MLLGGWIFLISGTFFLVGQATRAAAGLSANASSGYHLLSIGIAGGLWLAGRYGRLSGAALRVLDAAGTASMCASLAAMAAVLALGTLPFKMDVMHALFLGMMACSFVLTARAIALPSTPIRTAWIGALSMLPMVVAAARVAAAPSTSRTVPTIGIYFDVVAWSAASVAMSVVASRVIFGLRTEMRKITRLGQYTLEQKLGEGGMGVVYRARHALLRRPTAVKLLPPDTAGEENILRFEREVQLTAELSHPSTVAIFDYGRTPEGTFYYAMEYLDGLDLQALVDQFGPQPPGRVIHILQQVCGALAEAHGVGLVHRDIKPANIILCERGGMSDVAKVVDFGLVKRLEPGRLDATALATTAHTILGTPLYMAPEAFAGGWALDARCDLYSVAAVGYFLLTGTPVFRGKSLVEIGAHHLHAIPEPPSSRVHAEIPPALERVVLQCLAKSPDDRPPDAASLQRLLLACAGQAKWPADEAARWWAEFRRSHPSPVPSGRPDAARITAAAFGDRG